jgi:hypothetical protein
VNGATSATDQEKIDNLIVEMSPVADNSNEASPEEENRLLLNDLIKAVVENTLSSKIDNAEVLTEYKIQLHVVSQSFSELMNQIGNPCWKGQLVHCLCQ